MEVIHHYAIQVPSLEKSCFQFVSDNYKIAHHGIEGQKWGVRRGPPYPLTPEAKSQEHSAHKKPPQPLTPEAKERILSTAPFLYEEAKRAIISTVNGAKVEIILDKGPVTVCMDGHSSDQFVERGLDGDDVLDALKHSLDIKERVIDDQGRPSQKVIGSDVTVAVNPETGYIATFWPTSERIRKKYNKEKSDE